MLNYHRALILVRFGLFKVCLFKKMLPPNKPPDILWYVEMNPSFMRVFIGTTALGSAGVGSGLRSLAGVGRGRQAFMGLGSRSSSNAPHSFNYSAFLYNHGKQFLLKSLRVPSKQSLLFLSHDCRFSELAAIHEEAGV